MNAKEKATIEQAKKAEEDTLNSMPFEKRKKPANGWMKGCWKPNCDGYYYKEKKTRT